MLSAAQPQPNAQGVTIALVAGIPLCRAALKWSRWDSRAGHTPRSKPPILI